MQRCSVCADWGTPPSLHLHIEENIEGILEPADIVRNINTKASEELVLDDNIIVYRYVQWAADLHSISSSQKIASKALCMCVDCLRYSLSFLPHYGDGAYCTANEHLKTEHPSVFRTHGIDIRAMNYRVVLKIKQASKFKKIDRTAGVIRSIPIGKEFSVDDLVFTDDDDIKIIGFQQWDGTSWVDVILDDLQGVS